MNSHRYRMGAYEATVPHLHPFISQIYILNAKVTIAKCRTMTKNKSRGLTQESGTSAFCSFVSSIRA